MDNKIKKVSMKEIHETLLKLVIEFDKFCTDNNIEYYLMGGSALGAIRHHGFIPWDDDIDVFMTYDNYIRFIELCKNKLDTKKFYFQEGNSKELKFYFSKFRMNNTTFIEKDTMHLKNFHHGFYIDIMCLYNTSSNKFFRKMQYIAASILKTRALADINYNRNVFWKKFLIFVSKIIVCKPVKKLLFKIVNMYKNKNVKYVGHFFGRARFNNTSFPKEYLGKPRYVDFENTKLPVPEKAEEYLRIRYGDDFMKMPDQKTKDKYPSHAYIVDPYNDYKKYIND